MGLNESQQQREEDLQNESYNGRHRKLIKTIVEVSLSQKNQKIKGIDGKVIQSIYQKCDSNIEEFFKVIQKQLASVYNKISEEIIQSMNQGKVSLSAGQLYLAQQILSSSLTIIEVLGKKTNFNYQPSILEKLNSIHLSIIDYLKVRYPKNSANYAPHELMNQFRNFNTLEEAENDVLRRANIYFGDENPKEITNRIQTFFNLLIDEMDDKFQAFQQLLTDKIFVIQQKGKKIHVENAILRKIPQTVSKFTFEDQISSEIRSSQILRVIYKWASDIEDYLLNPSDEILQKSNFKLISVNEEGTTIFDDIYPEEVQELTYNLERQLLSHHEGYKKDLQSFSEIIGLFNHNLIKVLIQSKRKQIYIPQKEAELIKYSSLNTKIISWMIIEKLKLVLKKLIKVGSTMKNFTLQKMDLIKFNVTDLFKANMKGSKIEILKVNENLKLLEKNKQVKILSVQNKLTSSQKQVIIVFTFSKSFLFCQLTLVLSDQIGNTSSKLKNIEDFNTFLKKLEKSPYGVMTQFAILMGFQDSKASYEEKIHFETKKVDFTQCSISHPNDVLKIKNQQHPFMCSSCLKYKGPFKNIFPLKMCRTCNKYICSICSIKEYPSLKTILFQKQIQKRVISELKRLNDLQQLKLKTAEVEKKLSAENIGSSKFVQAVLNFMNIEQLVLANDIGHNGKLEKKHIKNYIYEKKDKNSSYLILFGYFEGEQLFFKAFGYLSKIQQVKFGFNRWNQQKLIKYKPLNFLLFIPSTLKQYQPPGSSQQYLSINMVKFTKINKQQVKAIYNYFCSIQISAKNKTQLKFIYAESIQFNLLTASSEKNYQTSVQIDVMRRNLPQISFFKENIDLINKGIVSNHFSFFSTCEWKTKIHFLNLSNNLIKDVSVILSSLHNLKKINISMNQISSLNFDTPLPQLIKLNAKQNYISSIKGIKNIPSVQQINLFKNYLPQFNNDKVALKNLKFLNLLKNAIAGTNQYTEQTYPNLLTFFMEFTSKGSAEQYYEYFDVDYEDQYYNDLDSSQDYYQIQEQPSSNIQTQIFSFPKLISFHALFNKRSILIIDKCDFLQNLKILESDSSKIVLSNCPKLQEIHISNSKFDVTEMISNQLPALSSLLLERNEEMSTLPDLNMPELRKMKMSKMKLRNISSLQKCTFNSLTTLILLYNSIQSIPQLEFPKLQILKIIQNNQIHDVTGLSNSKLGCLQILIVKELIQTADMNFVNDQIFPALQTLQVGNGKISELENDNVKKIKVSDNSSQFFPVIKGTNLEEITYRSSTFASIDQLSQCRLSNLKFLNLIGNTQENPMKFPFLNIPTLKHLYIQMFTLDSIQDLMNSSLSTIESIQITDALNVQLLPLIKFQTLKKLTLVNLGLVNVKKLSISTLPCLEKLNISQNNFQVFPVMNFPKLEELNVQNCKIKNIENIALSVFLNLQTFSFQEGNQIQKIPNVWNFPNLKIFPNNQLLCQDLNILSNSNVSSLKEIILIDINFISEVLPIFKINSLKTFTFISTNITDIDNLTKCQFPSLKTLTLQRNKILKIPALNFPLLETIKANSFQQSQCKIKDIMGFEFSSLPFLKRVELQHNNIEQLPKMNFPNLKDIFISSNKIKQVSKFQLSNLPSLNILNMELSPVTEFPIGKNCKPSELYLKKAKIKDFSLLQFNCSKIFRFHYNIGELPDKIPPMFFQNANRIQFQQCNLQNIEEFVVHSFPQLEQISFVRNKIVSLPSISCPKLLRLFLNINKIKNISNFVRGSDLSSVKMFSLENNQIEDLIDFPFTNPSEIYLSHNFIKDLSCMSKYTYHNLTLLVALNCRINKLPSLKAPCCGRLYLNENQITTESLLEMKESQLPNLYLLQLSQNRVNSLEPLNRMKLPSLKQLSINKNQISVLSSLQNLKNLQKLCIQENPIREQRGFLSSNLPLYFFNYGYVQSEGSQTMIQKISAIYSFAKEHMIE